MKLILKTVFQADTYTIGKLYIDGVYFCDTLEDAVRDIGPGGKGKIKGETAIPKGVYDIELRQSPRFKRVLPRLVNVPFFEGILIHRGNTSSDTEGCILVGKNSKKGMVLDSRRYEKELIEKMQAAVNDGENITIEIRRL